MGLTDVINAVFTAAKGNSSDVATEYDKTPALKQPDIYAVIGVKYVKFSKAFCYTGGESYPWELTLSIRVLGKDSTNPIELYKMLDEKLLIRLTQSDYKLKAVTVSNAVQDHALHRLVINAAVTVSGSGIKEGIIGV